MGKWEFVVKEQARVVVGANEWAVTGRNIRMKGVLANLT